MARGSTNSIPESEVTPQSHYIDRRRFIATLGATAAAASLAGPGRALSDTCDAIGKADALTPTPLENITRYNNYYEFSTNKEAVHLLARELTLDPWTVVVDGEVSRPMTFNIEELQRQFGVEQRVYRLRCVEGWSMVIPWDGFPLCKLIRLVNPTGHARFVRFTGLKRPSEMIGQRRNTFPWPYSEGLRMDEAVHPLTMLATGLYGESLPKQNGAPVRLVVPWKYGFKSIKAITRITFERDQPVSSWQQIAPSEYGFYANVNPDVAHPRWNQRHENRIGELRKRKTELFNGYADEVGSLYAGLDLAAHF